MTSSLVLALSIVSTSFLGSWHCAAMCGPVASLMAQRKSLVSYHLGRLVSYATLGGVAGSLGQVFLNSHVVTLRWISASFLALFLFYLAMSMLFPKRFKSPGQWSYLKNLIQRFHSAKFFRSRNSGWVFGLLTALLPCGWLYTYVLAAMASGSIWSGVLVMTLFWLGGLPVLYSAPQLIKSLIAGTPARNQKIAGFVLIFSSFYSLCVFMFAHH
ncbi:hypothetical protein AZI86_13180 [Bdellovibrio bacteriovorus]|uniref:Urease accessory protein UreH-like transmembrane domain-containing protein n=2 Tax=Bdellovibrio bacteriovorus TaxID=959 RepID=A0A150WK93_BDEBC|nr:hypothetical protein AZI86_13180 [Bdellovibrio bacteriovorus]